MEYKCFTCLFYGRQLGVSGYYEGCLKNVEIWDSCTSMNYNHYKSNIKKLREQKLKRIINENDSNNR